MEKKKNVEHRALLLRIYPNQEQEVLINKTIGCTRFLRNEMLSERIETYGELKDNKRELYEHKYKTEKKYKEEYDWMKEVSAVALQQARVDLVSSYNNFFKSLKGTRKGEKVGFPKFQKKGKRDTYREVMVNSSHIDLIEHFLKLPKVGKVNFRHRKIKEWYFSAEVKNMTVVKKPSGKYFVSVLFEGEPSCSGIQDFTQEPSVIGLDMSMDQFYVDNYGDSPEYRRLYRESEEKLAKAQRNLSRTKKGSNRRKKAKRKVALLHEKISNQRKDFVHQLSNSLVKNHDVIVVESLSLKGMSQALNLGKSVHDLGYSEFVRQLKYKCLWNDKTLIEADQWFASSKTCSFCGFKKKDLMLQERDWVCPKCGREHNRDQNAGQNLRNYGLREIGLDQPESTLVESNIVTNVNDWTTKREAQG